MNILFIHQNFPGQFKHLAPALAARGDHVVALTMQDTSIGEWLGVKVKTYRLGRDTSKSTHPWVTDFEAKVIRGEACLLAALELKKHGFVPDVVVAHPGWGESLFVKEVWPSTKLAVYCEFFYRSVGADVGFDPEFFTPSVEDCCKLSLKNLSSLLHMEIANAGISPTAWQASTFPSRFQSNILVTHDGIDTVVASPNDEVELRINHSIRLSRQDEVITFVNRNLEPYRGYHIFMRALPTILRYRPRLRVLIVGGDGVSYGRAAEGGESWMEVFAREAQSQISSADWERVHFLGNIPYMQLLALFQLSSVHVYLTYPFVLSWSLLEAMSCGCAVLASDTSPVREFVSHDETGRLFNFFDAGSLAGNVIELLDDPQKRQLLGKRARQFIQKNYDLHTICLPRQVKWVDEVSKRALPRA